MEDRRNDIQGIDWIPDNHATGVLSGMTTGEVYLALGFLRVLSGLSGEKTSLL
jgi:hypothetical protein